MFNFLLRDVMLFLWIWGVAAQIPCATSIDAVSSDGLRIVGGSDAEGSIPWQVFLGNINGNYVGCGGTIIDANLVLTAAHCPQPLTVVAGAKTLDDSGGNVQIVRVASMTRHQAYDDDQLLNDIALIYLASSFTWTDFVKPACLPKTTPQAGANIRASGFGRRFAGANVANTQALYYVDHSVRSCQGVSSTTDGTYVCAGDASKGSCQGDSGGPTVHLAANGEVQVVGVVSHGGFNCNRGTAYTNVARYLDWLKENGDVEPSPTTTTTTTSTTTTTTSTTPIPTNTIPPPVLASENASSSEASSDASSLGYVLVIFGLVAAYLCKWRASETSKLGNVVNYSRTPRDVKIRRARQRPRDGKGHPGKRGASGPARPKRAYGASGRVKQPSRGHTSRPRRA